MGNRQITVRIHDENLSGPLEYELNPSTSLEDALELLAIQEVHFIRSRVGLWHDFTGGGDALLNSAHTIELNLTWWVMRKGAVEPSAITHHYLITEDETPESVIFGE